MISNIFIVISYGVALFMSLFSLVKYSLGAKDPHYFVYGTFIITTTYSCLGVARTDTTILVFPHLEEKLNKYHVGVLFSISTIGLPCMIVEFWLKHGILNNLKWFSVFIGAGLTLAKLYSHVDDEVIDTIVGVNIVNLLIIGIIFLDVYASFSGFLFTMAHFGTPHNDQLDFDISSEILYNYCLAGFVFSACLCFTTDE